MRSETFVCGAQGVPLCANPEQLRALGVGGIKPASALLVFTRFGNEATFAARRPASSRPSAGRYTESATLNARGIKLRHARAGAFEFQRRRSGQDREAMACPSRRNSGFDDTKVARGRRTARLSSMASPMPTGTIEAVTMLQQPFSVLTRGLEIRTRRSRLPSSFLFRASPDWPSRLMNWSAIGVQLCDFAGIAIGA